MPARPKSHARARPAPYGRSRWPADDGIDRLLLSLAHALVDGAPDRTVPIAELGDVLAVRLKQKGIHPMRDGKIVRLSAYMRSVHDGWEAFLAARVPEPLHVEGGTLRARAPREQAAPAPFAMPERQQPRPSIRAPHVSVDELDLSRM